MINLTVKTLDSQNHHFSLPDDYTIGQLKIHVAEALNVPAELQRFIYCGRILNDEVTLQERDLDGKVVHLVQRDPSSTGQQPLRDDLPAWAQMPPHRTEGSTLHLGAMTVPSDVFDLPGATQARPSYAFSRMIIARNMLRRAIAIVSRLEASDIPATHPTGEEDPSAARLPINFDLSTTSMESPQRMDVEAPASFGEDPDLEVVNSIENELNELNNMTRQPSDSSQDSGPSAERERPRVAQTAIMAAVLAILSRVHRRFWPYLTTSHRILHAGREALNLDVARAQRLFNNVSEGMHYISHAYHALSDIICDFSQDLAVLSARPIIPHHATFIQPFPPVNIQRESRGQILNRNPLPMAQVLLTRAQTTASPTSSTASTSSSQTPVMSHTSTPAGTSTGASSNDSVPTQRNTVPLTRTDDPSGTMTYAIGTAPATTINIHGNFGTSTGGTNLIPATVVVPADVLDEVGAEGSDGIPTRLFQHVVGLVNQVVSQLTPEQLSGRSDVQRTTATATTTVTTTVTFSPTSTTTVSATPITTSAVGTTSTVQSSSESTTSTPSTAILTSTPSVPSIRSINGTIRLSARPPQTYATMGPVHTAIRGRAQAASSRSPTSFIANAVSRTFDPSLQCHSYHIDNRRNRNESLEVEVPPSERATNQRENVTDSSRMNLWTIVDDMIARQRDEDMFAEFQQRDASTNTNVPSALRTLASESNITRPVYTTSITPTLQGFPPNFRNIDNLTPFSRSATVTFHNNDSTFSTASFPRTTASTPNVTTTFPRTAASTPIVTTTNSAAAHTFPQFTGIFPRFSASIHDTSPNFANATSSYPNLPTNLGHFTRVHVTPPLLILAEPLPRNSSNSTSQNMTAGERNPENSGINFSAEHNLVEGTDMGTILEATMDALSANVSEMLSQNGFVETITVPATAAASTGTTAASTTTFAITPTTSDTTNASISVSSATRRRRNGDNIPVPEEMYDWPDVRNEYFEDNDSVLFDANGARRLHEFLRNFLGSVSLSTMISMYASGSNDLLMLIRTALRKALNEVVFTDGYTPVISDLESTNIIINNYIMDHKHLFDSEQMRDEVDLMSTLCRFNRNYIPYMVNCVMNYNDDDFLRLFPQMIRSYSRQLAYLYLNGFKDSEVDLENALCLIANTLPRLSQLQTLFRGPLANQLRIFSACVESTDRVRDLERFVVYRLNGGITEQVPTCSKIAETFSKEEQMEVEPTNEVVIKKRSPTDDSSESDNDMDTEGEEWKNNVPSDWVPVISRDNRRLLNQNRRTTFSDAYMSGMPNKRRKLLNRENSPTDSKSADNAGEGTSNSAKETNAESKNGYPYHPYAP